MDKMRIIIYTLYVLCLFSHADASSIQSDDITNDILTRIDALEKQGKDQTKVNQRQQEQIDLQNEFIKKLKSKLDGFNQLLAQLEQQAEHIDVLTSELEVHTKTSKDQAKMINVLEEQVHRQQQTIVAMQMNMKRSGFASRRWLKVKTQKRSMGDKYREMEEATVRKSRLVLGASEGPIAFQARIDTPETDHLGIRQKIVFDVVVTNIGGGYHNLHGIFIAPRSGIYVFSTSILSSVNTNIWLIQVSIMKNGQQIARAYAHGDSGWYDQGSVTVVTQLATGDEVWVENDSNADDSIAGYGLTSFMGCMITQV